MEEERIVHQEDEQAKKVAEKISKEISDFKNKPNAQTIHKLLSALKQQDTDDEYHGSCEILSLAIDGILALNRCTVSNTNDFYDLLKAAFQEKENQGQFKNYIMLVDLLNAFYQNKQSDQARSNILNQLLGNYYAAPTLWCEMICEFLKEFYPKDETKQKMIEILELRQTLNGYRTQDENLWNKTLNAFDQFALQAIRGEITSDEKSKLINVGNLIQGRLEGKNGVTDEDISNKSKELRLSYSKFLRGLGVVLGVAGCLLAVACIVGLGVAYGGLIPPAMTALDAAIKAYVYIPMLVGAGIAAGGYMFYSRNKLTESEKVQSYFEKASQEDFPLAAGWTSLD